MLVALAAVLLAWIFVQLGSEMLEGDTRVFDRNILLAAQALHDREPWVATVMRDISGLGSTVMLTLCSTITVGYLALSSERRTAGLVAFAVSTGAAGISLLKASFGRARPGAGFEEVVAQGLSFPSGHAGMSAIVFLTLGTLLASTRCRLAERVYILAVAAFMTLIVGLSRVALGVHWATDVLAGWAYGFAWALFWLLVARSDVGRRGAGRDPDDHGHP